MRIIFMGTPDFAVNTLEALIEAKHEVVLVITQPDKPKGRGKSIQCSPVKEAALAHGMEVYQPKRIRDAECAEKLRKYEADLMVVAAFGQILPEEILQMPRYGCVNVHASLLPKYRGAAPIQWAVINGDRVTGVTIMQMAAGLDTGDILEQAIVEVADDETGGSLFQKLAEEGARLCVQTIAHIAAGTVVPVKQEETQATHVRMISKEMGSIDWQKPADEIERLIRGLNPWPSAFTKLGTKTLKIWGAAVIQDEQYAGYAPGTVVLADKKQLVVQTGAGQLSLTQLQLEGKKRMPADAFLRGCPVTQGTQLGGQNA